MSNNVVPMPGIVLVGSTARRASHVTFAEHFTSQVITQLLLNGAALSGRLKPWQHQSLSTVSTARQETCAAR